MTEVEDWNVKIGDKYFINRKDGFKIKIRSTTPVKDWMNGEDITMCIYEDNTRLNYITLYDLLTQYYMLY